MVASTYASSRERGVKTLPGPTQIRLGSNPFPSVMVRTRLFLLVSTQCLLCKIEQKLTNCRPLPEINFASKRKRKTSDSVLWQKPLHPQKKSKKQRDNTKIATKNFDNTTIADRLRTVSWSNNIQFEEPFFLFWCSKLFCLEIIIVRLATFLLRHWAMDLYAEFHYRFALIH